jgi:hypothetical protein
MKFSDGGQKALKFLDAWQKTTTKAMSLLKFKFKSQVTVVKPVYAAM